MVNSTTLKIAVMGAGAVGCYYGAMLAKAGHSVVLVARLSHVQAIAANGLRLQTAHSDEHIGLTASTQPSALSGADVVLFCVKSTDTQTAGRAMQSFMKPGALVVCLQNGVDNAERLRPLLPNHEVVAAAVYVATEMAGPGYVKHHGRGELVLGPSAAVAVSSQILAKALVGAGVAADVSRHVGSALWAKLTVNCAYNAVSAITQLPYGRAVLGLGVEQVMHDAVAECVAVAAAQGVALPNDIHTAVYTIGQTMPGQYSSTAQDLARGVLTEIDHLNGFIVQRGAALGVATPVNRVLWALVKLLESKQAR